MLHFTSWCAVKIFRNFWEIWQMVGAWRFSLCGTASDFISIKLCDFTNRIFPQKIFKIFLLIRSYFCQNTIERKSTKWVLIYVYICFFFKISKLGFDCLTFVHSQKLISKMSTCFLALEVKLKELGKWPIKKVKINSKSRQRIYSSFDFLKSGLIPEEMNQFSKLKQL